MKKKLYILGLVVILGLGGAYAIAGNSDTNVCFWKGRAYQPGEVWEEVGLKIEENSTALFDCKESIEFEIFPHFRYKYAPNVTHCHEHWFLLAVEQEFEPILSEHLAYQWVSPEHAIQMTKSPNNAEAIKKYLMNGFPL